MDIFGILGLVVGFGSVLAGYIIEGGHLGSLALISPFIIVFGGTTGVILLSFNTSDISGSFKALLKTFSAKEKDMPTRVIEKVRNIANVCRSEGLLKLQSLCEAPEFSEPDFLTLKAGMVLALDMKDASDIQEALDADLEAFMAQRQAHMQVFQAAGGFSPTLGIIGTVMGLVHVLGNMSDPEALVGSIGAAFIATLYGVGFANLVFLPCANRIKSLMKREMIMREMMIEGICLIVKGEPTRSIENKLSVFYQAFPGGFKSYRAGISK